MDAIRHPSFRIRSSPDHRRSSADTNTRGLGSHYDDSDAQEHQLGLWITSSTGSVHDRNQHRLKRTRFVKEGQTSRQWTGNRITIQDDEASRATTSTERAAPNEDGNDDRFDTVDEDASVEQQAQTMTSSAIATKFSLASFYAEMAASGPTSSLPPIKPLVDPATAPVSQDTFSTSATSPPSTLACPTCSSRLPNPCPPDLLRRHLSSLAHRLALTDGRPPPPKAATLKTASSSHETQEQQQARDRLELDARNKGYLLLGKMGWEEGMGVGRGEWEWKEEQRQLEEDRKLRSRSERAATGEAAAIIISSDEDDSASDLEDVFNLPKSPSPVQSPVKLDDDEGREASSGGSSAPDPGIEPSRKRAPPRLVPVSIAVKHDRRGLGVKRKRKDTSTTAERSSLQSRAGSHVSTSPGGKDQRKERRL